MADHCKPSLPSPFGYFYHDAPTAEEATSTSHSILFVPASERRPTAQGETPVYTEAQLLSAIEGAAQPVVPPSLTAEKQRLVGVIADKIEDGTLFQAGIYSRKQLADIVRTMLEALPASWKNPRTL